LLIIACFPRIAAAKRDVESKINACMTRLERAQQLLQVCFVLVALLLDLLLAVLLCC
jgi:hypothetical protein